MHNNIWNHCIIVHSYCCDRLAHCLVITSSFLQSAHYHSGGWRINPNLYEEGKVCLSLLNTWTGRGNEVWDPQSSSILQVLVSLQGLVLNAKPYFNEAGYDKQIGTAEGEKNSLSYNENTFLLNCKTMMYLIRKPPKVTLQLPLTISGLISVTMVIPIGCCT